MSIVLRIVITVLCLAYIAGVFYQVARKRLLLKYSILWIALAMVALIVVLIPQIAFFFSGVFGFDTPSNFVFFVAMLFLMAICVSLSAALSKCILQIKSLTQELALLKSRMQESIAPASSNDCDESRS